jgi:hypothetical protein
MTTEIIFLGVFRLYRLMWSLYPPSFRTEFCDEIMCDFADATNRARSQDGLRGVSLLVIRDVCDCARNLLVIWFRTGIPTLIVVSAACSTLLFGLVALQGVAPTNPAFVPLHLVWLIGGGAVVLCSIAVGKYHGRHAG